MAPLRRHRRPQFNQVYRSARYGGNLNHFLNTAPNGCNVREGVLSRPCINGWQYKYTIEIAKVLRLDDFAFGWIEMGTVRQLGGSGHLGG
jgi:hypothetical protein